VERVAESIEEGYAVPGKRREVPLEDLASRLTLLLKHGQIPHRDREVDRKRQSNPPFRPPAAVM
jgi:hypothetical protein